MEIKAKNKKRKMPAAETRYLYDLKSVLYDREWLKKAENFPVYFMKRGVKEKGGLRYDITIIPPRMFGREFPKTKGHKHAANLPELINALEGEAFYFSQKGKGGKIQAVQIAKAKKGDWIILPAGFDHLTINPGKKKLVMANWVSFKAVNDYSLFEKYGGACYFFTKSGWIKNKNYKSVPKIKFVKPLKKAPKNLAFLK